MDDFSYARVVTDSSWWSRLKHWLGESINHLLESILGKDSKIHLPSYWLEVLIWGLAITAVVLLIRSLFKGGASGIIQSNKTSGTIDFDHLDNPDTVVDWAGLIQQEVDKKNYKIAIRLLYLCTIHQLADTGNISWAKGLTNKDYAAQLAKTTLAAGFGKLTNAFEQIWYGDTEIDLALFSSFKEQFEQFNTTIAHVEKV